MYGKMENSVHAVIKIKSNQIKSNTGTGMYDSMV